MRYIARKIEHNVLKKGLTGSVTGKVFTTIGSSDLTSFISERTLLHVAAPRSLWMLSKYYRNAIYEVDSKCSFVRIVWSSDTYAQIGSFE